MEGRSVNHPGQWGVSSDDGVFLFRTPYRAFIGTAGRKANTVDYSLSDEPVRAEEKKILSRITGVPVKDIIMLNQVHGDRVISLPEKPREDLPFCGDADAMISNLEGICLVIRTADCVPLFAVDKKLAAAGAVHSGWKGCRLSIASRMIESMGSEFGSVPADLDIFILPSIGPDAYRVNEDVAQFFPRHRIDREGVTRVSLRDSVRDACIAAGVREENIHSSHFCTFRDNDRFFSHRRGDRGRNLNFILLRRD